MCKMIFITKRMEYLQDVKGFSITQAYNQAHKEWEARKGNSFINKGDDFHHDEEEDNG